MDDKQASTLTNHEREVLDRLVQQRGHLAPGEYTFFFVTGEGRYLPLPASTPPIEEASGYLLDKHDHVFFWWLGWDPHAQEPTLTTWRLVHPEPRWLDSPEYRRARARVGLAA